MDGSYQLWGREIRKDSEKNSNQKSLTWNTKNVSIFLAIVASMAAGTVSDGESRSLFADLRVFLLVLVQLRHRVLHAFLLELHRQILDGEEGVAAHHVLLEGVVNELVLVDVLDESFA